MPKFKDYIKENPDRIGKLWSGSGESRTFGYIGNKFFISSKVSNHPDFIINLLNSKKISIDDLPPYAKTDGVDRNCFKFAGRLWLESKVISFWAYPDKIQFHKLVDDVKKNGIVIDDDWKIDIKDKLVPISEYTDKFKNLKVKEVEHVLSPMLKKKKEPTRSGEAKMKLPHGITFAKYRSMITTSEGIEENASTVAPTSTATGQFSPHPGETIKREGSNNIKKKIQSKLKWKDKIHGGEGDKLKPSDVDQEELKMGIAHEIGEHGFKEHVATEVALDHIAEDPKYYSKMKKK